MGLGIGRYQLVIGTSEQLTPWILDILSCYISSGIHCIHFLFQFERGLARYNESTRKHGNLAINDFYCTSTNITTGEI